MTRSTTQLTRTLAQLAPVLAFLALVGSSGCSPSRGRPAPGTLIFDHRQHAAEADCGDCHQGIEKTSASPKGKFVPGKKACADCHEEELAKRCDKCHRGAKEGVRFARPDRALRFPHAAHGKVECLTCHPGAKEAGRPMMPAHPTCQASGCHGDALAKLQCAGCHENLQQQRLRALAGIRHGPGFAKDHGTQARQKVAVCVQCHDQTFCSDCHAQTNFATAAVRFPEEVDRGFIHRGDFLGRHAIEARATPGTCMKCHGQKQCRSCHALDGLAASADVGRGGRSRSVHPEGWMRPGGANSHGRKARQDIAACASCHDQGANSNCVGCHRVNGSGGNPHPAGWRWKDKLAECRSTSMCATCHTGGAGCR
ncbi:MAG: hypothetical protein IT371_25835 [Deltaproteobacteria bacterium]|nr:hypothetical protein [Deltaproteobacteria bacterium]